MNLRMIPVLAACVAALVVVPVQATAKQSLPEGVYVCQVNKGTGELSVIETGAYTDPQGAATTDGLKAKRSGNLNAAMHSPQMATCAASIVEDTSGWGGSGG